MRQREKEGDGGRGLEGNHIYHKKSARNVRDLKFATAFLCSFDGSMLISGRINFGEVKNVK